MILSAPRRFTIGMASALGTAGARSASRIYPTCLTAEFKKIEGFFHAFYNCFT
jgi:hypothetical protein